MNTATATEATRTRKAQHLEICSNPSLYQVEGGSTFLDEVRFVHRALPELSADEVDTGVEFLGYHASIPVLISCMTGGTAEGEKINRELVSAAQEARIPVGLGSMRVLLQGLADISEFDLKPLAPDVPVIGNIGAAQLVQLDPRSLLSVARRLNLDALAVHLNPAQELFQNEGDTDFRGQMQAIARLCERSQIPVIVKETGCGMMPDDVEGLLSIGVSYVDLAGSGGTNWVLVESSRSGGTVDGPAAEFHDWGVPASAVLPLLSAHKGRVLASGGIRTGMDVAKSLALGAAFCGMALPFLRDINCSPDRVVRRVEALRTVLRSVMVLTRARTIDELDASKLVMSQSFLDRVESIRSAGSADHIGSEPE